MVKKKVTCIGFDDRGKGIVRLNNREEYVTGLIPKEQATFEVSGKGIKLLSIENHSEYRTKPPCQYYKKCGGCQIQHLNPDGQRLFKEDKVKALLGQFGDPKRMLMMEDPYYYRNKSHATFQKDRSGKITSGIYEENTHRVVDMDRCIIQDDRANKIIETITRLLKSFRLDPYDEDRRRGFLRHVLIRTGYYSGQIMVVLVTGTQMFPSKNNFVKALRKEHPEITTVIQNINDHKTSMVLGRKEKNIFGPGYIEDTLGGLNFRISAGSFYQINPTQTEHLYRIAIEMADINPGDKVLDAYCGTGTIGILAAKNAESVIGVELNGTAVKDAIGNARRNGFKNIWFQEADASDYMIRLANDKQEIDVVFMDPPRSGSDKKFLDALAQLGPKRVVYVSCEPGTQARDLSYLSKKGYEVKEIQPVDRFPQTYHKEAVVKSVRKA